MNRLHLAQLPTPVTRLEVLSRAYQKPIWIKRDDYTGTEVSGNKVRKLEFAIADALQKGCDTVITTGGIQSNHCRATAAVCAAQGLACHLVLRGVVQAFEGNLFLDAMLGADIHLIKPGASREDYMQALAAQLAAQGRRPYLIPVGASNAVGSLGYAAAYQEITQQEAQLGVRFDVICLAVGSGGTYAGLWAENARSAQPKRIYGLAVDESAAHFEREIAAIVRGMDAGSTDFSTIEINDGYIGAGYAQARAEELRRYAGIAAQEGIVLDPCYTGKAFLGMLAEIQKGTFAAAQNILFIHTGGLSGWTAQHRAQVAQFANEAGKLHEAL